MATKIRIELNHEGIKQLLSSQPIADECEKAAQEIAKRAGDGFEVSEQKRRGYGGGRVGFVVYTDTDEAREAEAEDKVLSKAVRG